jgi:hypothetical protein
MSLLGKIAALFGGSGSVRTVCVVDGDRLAGGDRVGPGERFQALNRLARFASREAMDVKVVFGGRPLREAEDGASFNGVTVYYGESPDQVRDRLVKTLSAAGASRSVFVTSDPRLEEELSQKGFTPMRVSTLRKAMESVGGESSREGGGGGGGGYGGGRDRERGDRDGNRRGNGRNRGRGGRDRRPGGPREGTPEEGAPEGSPRRSESSSPAPSGDPVKSLIDLVE